MRAAYTFPAPTPARAAKSRNARPGTRLGDVVRTEINSHALSEFKSLHGKTERAPGHEFGLGDFEGRSFRGWHHHVTLASVALGFDMVRQQADEKSLSGSRV